MTHSDLYTAGSDAARAPRFRQRLEKLLSFRTDVTDPAAAPQLDAYLAHVTEWLTALGFACERLEADGFPFLLAKRVEGAGLPTILSYSHGDVVPGMEGRWRDGLDPWALTERGEDWFGRGIADNKGQFLVNLTALETVLAQRGALGANVTWIIEMGEEVGSPGLAAFCETYREELAADLLLASDGPRVSAERATLFLGARGGATFRLDLEHREAGRHSGNFGGALRNPAIEMAHALTSITDRNGALQIPDWTPGHIPQATRDALTGLTPAGGAVDADWGVPGLTPAERIHAWSSAEVLAMHAGDPPAPVNAIPPRASAWVQLRFAPGTDASGLETALRDHLDAGGFGDVQITQEGPFFAASRTPVDHPVAQLVAQAITEGTGTAPVILPSLGGSLPNDIFRDGLGLPTVWVPHSYPDCSQHAPDEHLPKSLLQDATGVMSVVLGALAGRTPEEFRG
ncbi:M20/M25/M40 family metallo-hydrolase [Gymnodinialimonas ceratoperidinii]|uniref:M20/M25/M40 family metallo-hydrolase n=1 Tax=Gymnodinialimonas ceratoperidinii TaxID=2856823 RepID=A0A8F6TV21_9RHOB|nr:M20/M25/M40 family metallo-hydrolase [Gymnodinialimonas ceratoperidinii]QXT38384.1 M20/M25/M40 family metallo-hydrolase [Gymnodinialimonas ceratoperidinii]